MKADGQHHAVSARPIALAQIKPETWQKDARRTDRTRYLLACPNDIVSIATTCTPGETRWVLTQRLSRRVAPPQRRVRRLAVRAHRQRRLVLALAAFAAFRRGLTRTPATRRRMIRRARRRMQVARRACRSARPAQGDRRHRLLPRRDESPPRHVLSGGGLAAGVAGHARGCGPLDRRWGRSVRRVRLGRRCRARAHARAPAVAG
jgi:hypothetical protein